MEGKGKVYLEVSVDEDGRAEVTSSLSNMGVLVLINDISKSILLEINKESPEQQEEE